MQKVPAGVVWRGLSLCPSVGVCVCELRPGCCLDGGSQTGDAVGGGLGRTAGACGRLIAGVAVMGGPMEPGCMLVCCVDCCAGRVPARSSVSSSGGGVCVLC